jgi:hypothetical protein
VEICLKARREEGRVEIIAGCELVDAVALLFTQRAPMLTVVEADGKRWIEVTAWERWRPGKSSAERTKVWRETRRAATTAPSAAHEASVPTVDVTSHVTGGDVASSSHVTSPVVAVTSHDPSLVTSLATGISPLLSSSSLSSGSRDAGASAHAIP